MDHQSILKRLAAPSLVAALGADIACVTNWAMLGPRTPPAAHADLAAQVKRQINDRWSCARLAPSNEVTDNYRAKLNLALCTLMHKHGFNDAELLQSALDAIDWLNEQVALDDHFYRQADAIKAFLATAARALLRRPAIAKDQTFYRAGDVVSYQLDGQFYAFYVCEIGAHVAVPLIEFFDACWQHRPQPADVHNLRARGLIYNDQICRVAQFWVHGTPPLLDPAKQFHVIASLPADPLLRDHLAPPVAGGSVVDVFRLQCDVRALFNPAVEHPL